MSSVPAQLVSVVCDTDVFSTLFVATSSRKPNPVVEARRTIWQQKLLGKTVLIAAQTRAELLSWPLCGGWGAKRVAALEALLASTVWVPVDDAVQRQYAELKAWGMQHGHGIQAKINAGDRWIAATARAHGLPIAAEDTLYDDIPDLVRL